MSKVPLASALRQLRAELIESMHAAEEEEIQFAVGDIELDLQFEVSSEAKGDAGIRFWLVSVGASAGTSRSTTHTVRLRLSPETSEGETLRVTR